MTPPTYTEELALDARDDARWEPDVEDFLSEHDHPPDCECERCTEDRELF